MTASALFAVEDVGKAFGRRRVLDNASLWVRSGRITALVGRNGEGKSTLLRVGCGLITADRGIVIYRGERLVRPRLARLARGGFFLIPDRSVLSSTFPVRAHFDAVARKWGRSARDRALDALEVREFLDRRAHTLSSGERRRVDVAVAVARDPVCVLADEPFLGIMPRDAERVGAGLRELAANGVGVAVTGQEVDTILDLADDVLWMVGGTTEYLGPPADARQHNRFRREYLGLDKS